MQSLRSSACTNERGLVFFFLGRRGGRKFVSLFFFGGVAMPSAQVKNGDKQFHANKSSMQPMKGSAWTHQGSSYFLCWKWGKIFLLFSIVPIMFPMCSCKVPQGFPSCSPQTSPIAPHFFPKWLVCPNLISHVYKLKRWALGNTFVSTFQLAVKRGISIGECPMLKKNGDGPLKKKKQKKV